MRRKSSFRCWCLVALLTVPVAASRRGGGKAQDPPPRRQHHHRQRLPAGRPRRPPPRGRDPAAARGGAGPAPDRGHQPGPGRRVHPRPPLLRPVRQGHRPPRGGRLRPHPLRPERRRQAGGVRGQLPQGLRRAHRPAPPGLPAGDDRPDDDHPLHDPRARRVGQRADPQGRRGGAPRPLRRVYPLPGRARARAGHAQLPPLPAREDPGAAPRVGQAVRPGGPGRRDGQPARRPFPGPARLVRRSPSQPGRIPRHRRRDGEVPREADPGTEDTPGPTPRPTARRSRRSAGDWSSSTRASRTPRRSGTRPRPTARSWSTCSTTTSGPRRTARRATSTSGSTPGPAPRSPWSSGTWTTSGTAGRRRSRAS